MSDNQSTKKTKKKMTDGEKGLGVLIALMGAAMGSYQTSLYGQKGDASPKHVLNDPNVRDILELDEESEHE